MLIGKSPLEQPMALQAKYFSADLSKYQDDIAIQYINSDLLSTYVSHSKLSSAVHKIQTTVRGHFSGRSSDSTNIYGILCDPEVSVACMLGLMWDGPFLSLCPSMPIALINDVVENSGINYVIVQSTYKKPFSINSKYHCILEFTVLDKEMNLLAINESSNVADVFMDENISKYSYIMSTSGSSGNPKLVLVSHSCIVTNISDFIKLFGITDSDVILSVSPPTFDPSIVDIFVAASTGAKLIMLHREICQKPKFLRRVLISEKVTFLQATPTLMKLLGRGFIRKSMLCPTTSLQTLALGGEQFPGRSELQAWFHPDCKTKVYNLYGLTELSCWASCQYVDPLQREENVSIGTPLSGVEIRLVDHNGDVVCDGVGEIQFAGERFSNKIFTSGISSNSESNFFGKLNTGDLGKISGGKIYFLGRHDYMVKRNGKRLSLLEVESAANKIENFKQTCAVYRENKLILFYQHETQLNMVEFLLNLNSVLDTWKHPDKYAPCNEWPLNANGKTDRLHFENFFNLANLELGLFHSSYLVASVWRNLLKREPRKNDNFVQCGGNSILAVEFSEILCQKRNLRVHAILDVILSDKFSDICSIYDGDVSFNDTTRASFSIEGKIVRTESISKSGYYTMGTKLDSFVSSSYSQLDKVWSFNLGKCIDSTPLVVSADGKTNIFMGSHSKRFCCIDADSGTAVWEIGLPDRIEASAISSVSGREVYVGCYDGCFYCISSSDGRIKFAFKTDGIIKCSAAATPGVIVFGSYDKHLYAIDEFGDIKWKIRLSDGSIFSTPVIVGDCVLVATLDGILFCLNLITANVVWKIVIGKPIFSSPALLDDSIVFGCVDTKIYCISFKGTEDWSFATGGPIFCSPSVLQNDGEPLIAIGSHDNACYLLNKEGVLLATIQLSSPIISTPGLFRSDSVIGILVCESKGLTHLYHYSSTSKKYNEVTHFMLPNEIFSSPVIYRRNIFVGCRDDNVYCYSFS